MQKLKILLAKLLRAIAFWLDPEKSEWNEDVLKALEDLVQRTAQFADGTTNEYKRQWVMHRVKKLFPSLGGKLLSLHLEYFLIQQDKQR